MNGYFPLREWHLNNFKSVVRAEIHLAPLTILVGSNSSGKSSLIQSILLLAQAAQGAPTRETLPLNGPLVSLGSFDDVLSTYTPEKAIVFGGTYVLSSRRVLAEYGRRRYPWRGQHPSIAAGTEPVTAGTVTFDITLKGKAKNEPGSANVHRVTVTSSAKENEPYGMFTFKSNRVDPEPQVQEMYAAGRYAYLPSRSYGDLSLSFKGSLNLPGRQPQRTYGLSLRAGLPRAFAVEEDEHRVLGREWVTLARRASLRRPISRTRISEDVSQSLEELAQIASGQLTKAREVAPERFWEELHRLIDELEFDRVQHSALRHPPEELVERIYRRLGQGRRILIPEEEFIDLMTETAFNLLSFLENQVRYVGPLRQDPQVIYKTAPSPTSGSLGSKGEYTAQTLHTFGDVRVVCPVELGERTESRSLRDSVSYWLDRHEIASSVQTRDLGRLGLELRVQERGVPRAFDLTNVGVGVSQLLPVIVTCLTAPPGALVLLEQPELHLNPAIQQRLGDFLLACSRSGRQLIVETHSEHILARLRRRIAEDTTDELLSYVRFIYAERKDGRTQYREVHPTRYGTLEEWPVGFFDQTAKESQEILRAAVSKRKLEEKLDQSPVSGNP